MEGNAPNFREIAKKIDHKHENSKIRAKPRIIPVLLGPYDDVSLSEMEKIKELLKSEGYVNASLIKDLPTENSFTGEYDSKYIHGISVFLDESFFIVPLFYFASKERKEQRIGHHGELFDLITVYPHLLPQTAYFHYHDSEMLNHVRNIPNSHLIKSFEEHQKVCLEFVNRFLPMNERKIIQIRGKENFYNPTYSLGTRGGLH